MEQRTGLGTRSEPGLPAPVPARARSPSRAARVRRAILVVLALAAPIAVAAWLTADELTARERRQADSRLALSLHAAEIELDAAFAAPDADAGSLARAPAVRRAVIRQDAAAVARLARTFPGLVVRAHGRRLTAEVPGLAHVKAAPVVASDGRVVGSIGIATPLDRRLLVRLQTGAEVLLLFEGGGRVAAATDGAVGGSIALSGLGPASVAVHGDRYRAVAAPVPDARAARLVALLPVEVVQKAEDRRIRRVILTAVLLLFLLTVAVDVMSAVVHRRRAPGAM